MENRFQAAATGTTDARATQAVEIVATAGPRRLVVARPIHVTGVKLGILNGYGPTIQNKSATAQ